MKHFFYWTPRVFSVAFAALVALVALFANDLLTEPDNIKAMLPAALMHPVPAVCLLAALAVAWRSGMFGTFVFLAAGIYYTVINMSRPEWVETIAGPLFLIGALYLGDWLSRRTRTG